MKQVLCFNIQPTGINEQDWLLIIKVFKKHPLINKVVLYGSRAKGNYKPYSDIDIIIFGSMSLMQLQEIENQLYDLNLPYTFDVSQHHTIKNNDLLEHIHRVGIIIYEKEL